MEMEDRMTPHNISMLYTLYRNVCTAKTAGPEWAELHNHYSFFG